MSLFFEVAKQSGFPRKVPNCDKGLLFIVTFAHKVNLIPKGGDTPGRWVSKNADHAQNPSEEGVPPPVGIVFTFEKKMEKWVG